MLVYSIVSVTVIFLIVAALLCLYKRKRAKLSSFFHGKSSSMATRRSRHRHHGNAGSDGAVMHVMYTSDEILKSGSFLSLSWVSVWDWSIFTPHLVLNLIVVYNGLR